MSTLTQACPFCGAVLAAHEKRCSHCHISEAQLDEARRLDFARDLFEQWYKDGVLYREQFDAIALQYQNRRDELGRSPHAIQAAPVYGLASALPTCWSCGAPDTQGGICFECGAPLDRPEIAVLRRLRFVGEEVRRFEENGRLPLVTAHACLTDIQQRLAALERRLERERLAAVEPRAKKAAPPPRPPRPAAPRRSVWEILLDPRSIQWLFAFGGVLLVLGLVLWMAAKGVFENPLVVAGALGLGNAALMGGGWYVIRSTRYETAGRAVTLLACLLMPLHLWFYHVQNLLTLENHLWVAALVICVIYAAAARVLRDNMFVYVLMGGVALTGLLILCDLHKFEEIAAPSTLLVVLGLIGIHVERAFPQAEGPFSRERFGLAFFFSGHALLGFGLILLLGTYIAGDWLYPLFKPLYASWHAAQPELVTQTWGQLLSVALVLAGTYAYLYSDLLVRRIGVYISLAAVTLLWAEVLLVELLNLHTVEMIYTLALTGLAINLLHGRHTPEDRYLRAVPPLGLFLSLLPVLLGGALHFRATNRFDLPASWGYTPDWTYVGAMLVTALANRAGAHLFRHTMPKLSATYFFGTAAATMVGAAGLLAVLNITGWEHQAPVLMLVPIAYLVASRLYRGHTAEQPLVRVAHAATLVMLLSSLGAALEGFVEGFLKPVSGHSLNLTLSLFCGEAAVCYGLAAALRKQGYNVYLATAMACGAVWQLLIYHAVDSEYHTLIFAALGMVLLVAYRLALLERVPQAGLARAAFDAANALMSLSFLAAALITLSRLGAGTIQAQRDWSAVGLLLVLALMSLSAAVMVQHPAWRRWYVFTAIGEGALLFLTLHALSLLTPWQKLEVFSVVVGLILLAVGHVGWYREQDREDDLVSLSLTLGSLLIGAALTVAVLVHRARPEFSVPDELGLLLAGVLLLGSGFVLQIRSTTLTGAMMITTYLVTLVLYINALKNIQTAAIWMALAGGTIFTSAILLSVYRDRLLLLPDQVKRREGIFRVLAWR